MDDIELGTIDYARDPPHPRESNAKSGACTRASKRAVDLLRARRVAKAYAPTLTGVLYRKKKRPTVLRDLARYACRALPVLSCASVMCQVQALFSSLLGAHHAQTMQRTNQLPLKRDTGQ